MTSNAIQVAVRCRPLASNEKASCININDKIITLTLLDKSQKHYTFTNVYNSTHTQADIYSDIGRSVITDALAGYNSCVFAYGLTGCFAANTTIMLINGRYKYVQDIDYTDVLMGTNGTPRHITQLIRNSANLYTVSSIEGFDAYIVNIDHLMVFATYTNCDISFNNEELKYIVTWFCGSNDQYITRKFGSAENAQIYASKIEAVKIVVISLDAYLKSNNKQMYYLTTTHIDLPLVPVLYDIEEYAHKLYHLALTESVAIDDSILYNSYTIRQQLYDNIISLATYQAIPNRYILTTYITNITYLVKSLGKRIYIISSDEIPTYAISDQCLYPVVVTYNTYGNYYGFTLDSDNMFVGAGFNQLHNSGKTHTMTGNEKDLGLTPRICKELMDIATATTLNTHITHITPIYKVEFSYMEIYSEHVYDLLHMTDALEVRQHPEYGPYVEGLTQVLVENYQQLAQLLEKGNSARTTACTLMNMNSSRSHAIATIHFTQIKDSHETVSKINLVDLAGSERIDLSGVTGVNLKEAININKSLSQLSLVISNLAKRSLITTSTSTLTKKLTLASTPTLAKKLTLTSTQTTLTKQQRPSISKIPIKTIDKPVHHINYRDSILTFILKESLGGNSKTYMIANISPSTTHRLDTISTLQYAQNASKIINIVSVNTDVNDKFIGVLKSEIDDLRHKLKHSSAANIKQLQIDLHQREDLMREREKTWEHKLAESRALNIINERKHQELQQNYNQLLQSQDTFERVKLVQTAMELHAQYEKRFDQLKTQYEEKLQKQNLEEIDKLRSANIALKENLSNSQRELHIQMRQFATDRSLLTKQIHQLQSQLHNTEQQQLYAEQERKYVEFCAEYQILDKKIEDGKKTLEDLNICSNSLHEEIQLDTALVAQIRDQYSTLKTNFENEKLEYNQLLTKKEELHMQVVTLRTTLEDTISSAKDQFATMTLDDLTQIKNNFDSILQSISY